MNAQAASMGEGLSLRRIVAFDVFGWNLKLGIAIAPRDVGDMRRRRRRPARLPDISPCLRADIGLPPEEDISLSVITFQHLLRR
jgi:hypothetical protein